MSNADLTLDPEILEGIRATVETTMRQRVQIWRSPDAVGSKTGTPTNTGRTSIASIFTPSTTPQIALLADLGAGRGSRLGFVPFGTDVRAGDELRIGAVVYQVLATSHPLDMVICALSEVSPL